MYVHEFLFSTLNIQNQSNQFENMTHIFIYTALTFTKKNIGKLETPLEIIL